MLLEVEAPVGEEGAAMISRSCQLELCLLFLAPNTTCCSLHTLPILGMGAGNQGQAGDKGVLEE